MESPRHRPPTLLLAALLGAACAAGPQELRSPCLTEPSSLDAAACPACSADDDCAVSSNPCQASASCVPKAGNWAVTQEGCSAQQEHEVPPASSCVCLERVCRKRP